MSKYSFEIKDSRDLFQKLVEEFSDFIKDPTSSRYAINCAMTAWHLVDWVFIEFSEKHGLDDLGEFRQSLDCESLFLMHDIANGSKHLKVSRPKSSIEETQLQVGDFEPADFSISDFNVSKLELRMKDGSTKDFITELGNVLKFWDSYFNSI